MTPALRPRFAAALRPLLLALAPILAAADDVVLLEDDFRALTPGLISGGVIGAQAEYHYLTNTAPRGNWSVSNFRSDGSQRAWRLIEENGRRAMWQSYTNVPGERTYAHLMLVAGDVLWSDYTFETAITPDSDEAQSGVLFLYRHDRAYYFAGVIGQRAVLKKVNGGTGFRALNESILAEQPFAWKPGETLPVRIHAQGGRLRAEIAGRATLETQDTTFTHGRIGFTSDVPTKFHPVRITASAPAHARSTAARAAADAEESSLQAANPRPVVWKRIHTRGFGTGRNFRFGDLNGDGQLDILICQMKHHGPGDSFSEVGCLTAIDLDGNILWQNGRPDSWATKLTNDVAFQIHDFDGDGRNDVVYCRDFEIVVADGRTGVTKYKAPTPLAPPDAAGRPPRYERILGDSMVFADLRGTGRKADLVLKDRYRNVWAYNDKLEPLWTVALNTGHYPFPHDVDGDGRDEVVVGYTLLSPDGKKLWTNEDKVQDHADGVSIVQLKDGAAPVLITAASDEGLFFTDLSGKILKRHHIGHTQDVSVADYRPDLPGLEVVAIDFWATQGITVMLNSEMEIYHEFEPVQHGSALHPVNWTGRAGEFWLLSTNSEEGGMYDGWGRRVVRFPADGHPDMASAVLDVTGDGRDEIITWDPFEIWIYTQSDNPKPSRLYAPTRNPLHNYSNYMTILSLPGWK